MVLSGNRAVAYFDILGFKNKIINTPINQLSDQYEKLIYNTDGQFSLQNGAIIKKQVCYRYIFSDSMFLLAKEDTEESFIYLLSYAWRMMQFSIVAGFPLRGAITYGEVYANIEKNIFLGKAISEAAMLESKQNWIGAIVDQPVINRYKTFFERDEPESAVLVYLLPQYNVPLKDGSRKEYHVINWRQNMVSEDGIKALFKNEPFDSRAQEKIDNTLCFAKEIVNLGSARFNDPLIPERYRTLFVGHRVPLANESMFTNGDEY